MVKRTHQVRFCVLVMLLNAGVAGMFVVVTTPAPTVRAQAVAPILRRSVAVASGVPNRLVVQSVGVDLPVGLGSYDQATDSWTLSDDQAYYADTSVPVNNNNGTTLIYGHARDGLFGSLADLQVGARAAVYTNNGQAFYYQYQLKRDLDPTDTSIFTSDGPSVLVLQTCAGEWDSYRAMYTFQFVGHEQL